MLEIYDGSVALLTGLSACVIAFPVLYGMLLCGIAFVRSRR